MNARKKYFTSDILFRNPTKIFNILKKLLAVGKSLFYFHENWPWGSKDIY